MNIQPSQRRTWAEIDISAASLNFKAIKSRLKPTAKLCCVVKANAYGHGAAVLARLYEKEGADFLAVSNIEEAMQIRNVKVNLPILILGHTDPECAKMLAENNISQCVFSEEYAKSLSEHALKANTQVKIHIKIDTGMGRIGFQCRGNNNELESALRTCMLPSLITEGIFTHFASADEGEYGKAFTESQFKSFLHAVDFLESRGVRFEIRHCANSAAIFDYPEMHLDMVRAGIVLFGAQPSKAVTGGIRLYPVLKLKTIVDHIKTIHTGDTVSYGRKYISDGDRVIATVPIGYADGLWRSNGENGTVMSVCGHYAPIVGRVCMDQCMLDITGIDGVKTGTPVTVYGEGECSVDRIAENNSTINYEIFCALGERVPRVYIENGGIVYIQDNVYEQR